LNGTAEHFERRLLDAPGWRLVWIAPLALFAWTLILAGFARMLAQKVNVQPEAPIRARLYELPPSAAPLKPSAPHAPTAAPHPAPKIKPHRAPITHNPRPRPIAKPKPAPAPSDLGTAKSLKTVSPPPTSTTPSNSAGAKTSAASSASANTSSLGGDDLGAQAIYAPPPQIPDDLRDEPLSVVAVAHFVVTYAGGVTVTLTTPTEIPRLNEVILDALHQWRFTPAKKNGVAINSAFDLQIPISIQ